MCFELSDQNQAIMNSVRSFTEREVAPCDARMDEDNEINPLILRKMKEIGLWGLIGPPEFGGAGADGFGVIIAMEELAKGSASIAITIDAHWLCLQGIDSFGNQEQKKRYLPALCSGSTIGAFSWTEPGAGSDAANIQSKAGRGGNGYLLNGEKCFCTNGDLAGAFLIGAVTGHSSAHEGLSIFIVEKGAPGLTVGPKENKMGLRGSHTTTLFLEDVAVSEQNILGEEGDGFRIFANVLNTGRLAVAGISIGLADAAMNASIDYAVKRQAFGKPLAQQQAVQFMIADMDTRINAARGLAYHAAHRASQGLPCFKEAAQAKYFASEVALDVCRHAVQIHGGHGYLKDYPVERYFRDAKFAEIGEGASEVLRTLVAKAILKTK